MSCEALQSIAKTCDNNTGGIRTVWICQQENVTAATVSGGAWTVSTLTLTANANVYAINRNTGNYTEDTAQDLLNGSTLVTQTITLMFNRRDKDKSEAIHVLGSGQQYLAVFVLDANGKYWYFENVQLTATGEGSGTARADGSKYSVTLLAEADHLAYEVTANQIEGQAEFPDPTQA
jgi:hypothetical protein